MMMPPVDPSQAFVRARFQACYRREGVLLPDRFGRREWGFIPFGGGIIQRHLGFSSKAQLKEFLVNRGPAHAYHSAAYYERPAAATMQEKGWLGADLIFDLDADHIPGAKAMSYPEMLEAVKGLFIRLLDEFLLGDLSIEENSLQIAFSGARGYHAHIRDLRDLALESHERREIVDYITGTDLDLNRLIREKAIGTQGKGKFEKVLRRIELSPASSPGWEGRFNRALVAFFEDLSRKPDGEAISKLTEFEGIGEARARIILKIARNPQKMESIEQGFLEQDVDIPSSFWRTIAQEAGIRLAGETDEPVTSDIKRLIRLMGSLHGKTGMRVTPLTRDTLEEFDPLRDAFPATFGDEAVKVVVQKPIGIDIRGEAFKLEQGPNLVPEHVAIFLICRGVATLA